MNAFTDALYEFCDKLSEENVSGEIELTIPKDAYMKIVRSVLLQQHYFRRPSLPGHYKPYRELIVNHPAMTVKIRSKDV